MEMVVVREPRRELLIVLDANLAKEALAKLRTVGQVTQVFEPRLALLIAEPTALRKVERIPGVLFVGDDTSLKEDVDFSPEERTFVRAWQMRRRPKGRLGDGSPWDAPGFLPPDRPSRRH